MVYKSFRPDPDYADDDELSGGYGWYADADGNETYGADRDLARQLMDQQAHKPPQIDQRLALNNIQGEDSANQSRADFPLETTYGNQNQTKAEAQGQQDQGLLSGEGGGIGEFDTRLSPAEEKQFQAWKAQYAPNDSGADYDLRGAFKAGLKPDQESGHWPDTFKKPNHPTFSDESIYAKGRAAGHWEGENYVPANARPDRGFDAELVRRAEEAGLDPAAIRQVIQRESQGNPAAVNPQSGATGLIQFMPNTAESLGTSTEALKKMSAEEQLPYVIDYFKRSGVTADTPAKDYYTAVSAPAFVGKPDGASVYRQGSKAYEQNQGWDINRDGNITAGELREWGARGGNSGADIDSALAADPNYVGGDQMNQLPRLAAQQEAQRQQMAGAQAASPVAGLRPAQVQVQGIPKTPQQIQEQQAQTAAAYDQVIADANRARDERVKARADAAMRVQDAESARQTQAFLQQQRAMVAKEQADKKIEDEVNRPIEKVDPKRIISGMTTGQKILGLFAAMLSGAGSAIAGGPNLAIQAWQKAIDDDIDAQKENIRSGKAQSDNRVAYWTRKRGSAEQGELAARAEYYQAGLNMLKAQDMSVENADIQAQHQAVMGQLELNKNAAIQNLKDIEANRYVTQYTAPVSALTGPLPTSNSYDPASDNPELSGRLAREFQSLPPQQQEKQLSEYGKSMASVDEFGNDIEMLIKQYGVALDPETGKIARNAQGQAVDKEGKPVDFGTAATGPWWNILDYDTPIHAMGQKVGEAVGVPENWRVGFSEKDRRLAQRWDKIRIKAREGWKTEPNGQVWQERLSGIDIPRRDEDTADVLDDLIQRQMQIRKGIRDQYAPQVRGYYAQQQAPVRTAAPRAITGRYGGP